MVVGLFSSDTSGCETLGSLFANQAFFFSWAPQPQDEGISRKENLMKLLDFLRSLFLDDSAKREEKIKKFARMRKDCFFSVI